MRFSRTVILFFLSGKSHKAKPHCMRRFEHKGILCISRWPLWSAVRKFFFTDKRSGGVLKEKRKEDKRVGRRAAEISAMLDSASFWEGLAEESSYQLNVFGIRHSKLTLQQQARLWILMKQKEPFPDRDAFHNTVGTCSTFEQARLNLGLICLGDQE